MSNNGERDYAEEAANDRELREGDAELIHVEYTVQYCRGDDDITSDFYAAEDADTVRFWEGDFCLIEVTRWSSAGSFNVWQPTGGDSAGWTKLAEFAFRSPKDALETLLPPDTYTLTEASNV